MTLFHINYTKPPPTKVDGCNYLKQQTQKFSIKFLKLICIEDLLAVNYSLTVVSYV